ncbi:Hypothetical predicted protein [Mytilus galloprovincialis]|nr:Hypothetical predicted protein [Mytilus galloprovincialis]
MSSYVYYPTLRRFCIPYLNCEPGNEIQPCTDNYMQDLCKPCRVDMVQPDLISSTGNINKSLCFKPTSECLARDLTYRRTEKDAFCGSLNGCRCDTTKCYFGDPCLCDIKKPCAVGHTMNEKGDLTHRRTEKDAFCGGSLNWCRCDTTQCYFGDPCLCDSKKPCAVGHTMNEKGVCSPCPNGTFKNVTGCGPCRHINSVDLHPMKNSQLLQTEHYINAEPYQQLSTETSIIGTKHDKQQDGTPIPLQDHHLPLLHENQELISGVSHFNDLDHVRCDGSIEDQIDNLKLQVFSGGNKTNPLSNRRTLRRIPTESEDENSVATVPMFDLEKKDENCNNVLSNKDIKSGNTDANEHFGFAYKQTRMQPYNEQVSSEEYVNNSYSSGYKTNTLNYTKDYNDPMSGPFITMHSPVFDSLATEELPSSIETYTFNISGNNGF